MTAGNDSRPDPADAVRSLLRSRLFWLWLIVWLGTRGLMFVQVGFWDQVHGVNYQDVEFYRGWSETLAHLHVMPGEESWQYPPGAAFLLLLPRLGGTLFGLDYQPSFVALMLLVDFGGMLMLAALARRTGRNLGVWIWLLALPLLQAIPLTRFDLVPTVLMMAAMIVLQRRPGWFGALVGAGTAIKVFPALALFGEWDRRRLLVSVGVAVAVIAASFAVAGVLFGDQSGFLHNQGGRGLQKEAVADIPWYAAWMVTGREPPIVSLNGTGEIHSGAADAVATVLKWLGLLVLLAAALWWVARERAIRRGRSDLEEPSLGRDFIFTLVLLQVVVSRVLSPQYMIWLIGASAVLLSAGPTRLRRPIWIVFGAVVLTDGGIYTAPGNMLVRNLALLVAAIDATVLMVAALRTRQTEA